MDDMISSGDTMIEVAKELRQRKAGRIFLCSTFGIFTKGMEPFDDLTMPCLQFPGPAAGNE